MVKIAAAVLGVLAVWAGQAMGQGSGGGSGGGPPREAYVVRVRGGLDCAEVARGVGAAVDEAEKQRSPAFVVLLENAGPTRWDIVRDVIGHMGRFGGPTVVAHVGEVKQGVMELSTGEVAVSMAAGRRIAERVVIRVKAAETREGAASKADWASVEDELRGVLRPRLAAWSLGEVSLEALLGMREQVWAVVEGDQVRAMSKGSRPTVSASQRVVPLGRSVAGEPERAFVLDEAEGVVASALFGEPERGAWVEVLSKSGVVTRSRADAEVVGGVAVLRERAGALVETAESAWREIGSDLRSLPTSASTRPATAAQKSAARRVKDAADRVGAGLDEVERVLMTYPEVAAVPPPGATKVGSRPSTSLTAWRNRVKDLREKTASGVERAERALR